MKKKLIVIFCSASLIITAILYFYDNDKSFKDFRNASWGMSANKVKKTEKAEPLLLLDDFLFYKDIYLTYDVHITYFFGKTGLSGAAYVFSTEHDNTSKYLNQHNEIKAELTKQYGEPVKDEEDWENDLYKDAPEKKDDAIRMGHLNYTTMWETDRTYIVLKLELKYDELTNTLNYYDINDFAVGGKWRQQKLKDDHIEEK